MKKIKFSPGDRSYRWESENESPFLKRNLTTSTLDKVSEKKLLVVKEKYYRLFFSNTRKSYLSRNLKILTKTTLPHKTNYVKVNDLPGNINQIRFNADLLLKHIISSFESNPNHLFKEAKKIKSICENEHFVIPKIKAFHKLNNWEEFMRLLKSIHQNNSSSKFELLIAAITQYASLCGSD